MVSKTVEKRNLQVVLDFLNRVSARPSYPEHIEEELFRMREGYERFAVEKVEPQAPDKSFEKPASSTAPITYFEATIQRTQLVGHLLYEGQEVPIHYAVVGAVILKRIDGKFRVWAEPLSAQYIIAPKKFLYDADKLEKEFSGENGVAFFDSGADILNYTQLRIAAVNSARQRKWELRTRLLESWNEQRSEDEPGLLSISDSILHLDNSRLGKNVVGFVGMTYLPFKGKEALSNYLLLPAFKRSEVFRIFEPGNEHNVKYSWFLRIREMPSADPEFGLVRIETIARNDVSPTSLADELSEAFARERIPVTFPADNWDKMIFPHKLARTYVEGLFPTRETIRSFFKLS